MSASSIHSVELYSEDGRDETPSEGAVMRMSSTSVSIISSPDTAFMSAWQDTYSGRYDQRFSLKRQLRHTESACSEANLKNFSPGSCTIIARMISRAVGVRYVDPTASQLKWVIVSTNHFIIYSGFPIDISHSKERQWMGLGPRWSSRLVLLMDSVCRRTMAASSGNMSRGIIIPWPGIRGTGSQ